MGNKKYNLAMTPQQKADMLTDTGNVITIMISQGVTVVLDKTELKRMMKWDVANGAFVRTVLKIAKNHPALCPSTVDVPGLDNQISYISGMSEIEKALLGGVERAMCSRVAIEDQTMHIALTLYKWFCELEEQGEAAISKEMVDARKRWKKTTAASPIQNSIAAGGTATIDKVKVGTRFANLGETMLMVFKGSIIAGDGKLVYPGDTFVIPKDYTTITVQNKSAQTAGSYSVKQK